MANKKDKSIRRNSFNQIISYTTSSGLYGRIEFKPETSAFKTDDYNRVIGEVSDKMLDKLPDTEPEIVSNNWLDETDLLDPSTTPIASLWLSDSARNKDITAVDTSDVSVGPDSVSIIGAQTMLLTDIEDLPDHVFDPVGNDDEHGQRVYYHWPLRVGTRLWTDTGMSQPLSSVYLNSDNYAYSYFLIEAVGSDIDLKNKLSNAYTTFFQDVHSSIVNNPLYWDFGNVYNHPNYSRHWKNNRVSNMLTKYNNKPFKGCLIKVGGTWDERDRAEVTEIWKLVGEFKQQTQNANGELPRWSGGTIGI